MFILDFVFQIYFNKKGKLHKRKRNYLISLNILEPKLREQFKFVADVDECSTGTPCNSGVCTNTVGSFTCNCTGTGYEGDACQTGKYSLTT